MSETPETTDINNLVDAEARIAARQAELTKLHAENVALLGHEPHYVAQDRALRERRDQALQEITEKYDNQPSLIKRWFNKLGL